MVLANTGERRVAVHVLVPGKPTVFCLLTSLASGGADLGPGRREAPPARDFSTEAEAQGATQVHGLGGWEGLQQAGTLAQTQNPPRSKHSTDLQRSTRRESKVHHRVTEGRCFHSDSLRVLMNPRPRRKDLAPHLSRQPPVGCCLFLVTFSFFPLYRVFQRKIACSYLFIKYFCFLNLQKC